MKKLFTFVICVLLALSPLMAQGGQEKAAPAKAAEPAKQAAVAKAYEPDLSKKVELRFNLAYGNKSRTMTYNQNTPMEMIDGSVVTAGMLKPVWSYIEGLSNSTFRDVGIQDAKSAAMIQTESTSGFTSANIYGGDNISTQFMAYGAEGKFQAINELIDKGYMPNLKKYLEENPNIKASITAFDGNIYYIPYVAEVGQLGRVFAVRGGWITKLLDAENAAYDTKEYKTYVKPYFVGDKTRQGSYGGTVTPKEGVSITKKTTENIVQIMNDLPVKNGKTIAEALVSYIKRNYDYEKPSELYYGPKAAYDMDEYVALFRAIKANPSYLTDGKADVVWPYFSRQSNFRPEVLRMATWYNGLRVNGSDSYSSTWFIDKDGTLQYSYAEPEMYEFLSIMSDWYAEGFFYTDMFDLSNKANHRTALFGTDKSDKPKYGFQTYDFIASSTADALSSEITVILPPVAPVNGVWQYYMDNSRVIKPDGWGLSAASTQEETERACYVMDYFFSDEGHIVQNYGPLMNIESLDGYTGPDGLKYPLYKPWVQQAANKYSKGDLSVLQRDWLGSLMAIGYGKEIGFEYQYTSKRGFDAWNLLKSSTTLIPTYAGDGPKGENDNYYTLIPPAFSFTPRQNEILRTQTSFGDAVQETLFNVIRYKTLGNAPAGAVVPQSYEELMSYFNSLGLETYEGIYQASYEAMKAGL